MHQKAFGEFIQKLNDEHEQFLTSKGSPPSNVVVDICFCLDITGNKLQARSGGDCPEDVPEALNKCFTLPNWSGSNVRFIVLITDAPGHEQDLNDDINDAYRNGTGLTSEYMKKMENAFKSQYQVIEGRTLSIIELFDKTKQQKISNSFHFGFVLDDSGSMWDHWSALVQTYLNFWKTREND
ncbi:unnamed protein product [Rotaria magnacalcarata]|uniref:VWFA domain-containing protein n=1 Tax=Rotaria magnacalcarata TaxID=392030 RepID=A0A819NR26_9BILA|nr:unnamed protein product [Rotaria magnacalcarata]CAF3997108.1 unnamed protein product [Rotaria magnacalcarata]CAF4308758.1 unnamed protein product [Rotaria magnacalcarata]